MVWYASYGSNMDPKRFACYLTGGALPSMARTYPGARDKTLPRASRAVWMAGRVYFALESQVWTGGVAFLDPDAPGRTAGRAYLISVEQFADTVAQEMGREPPGDLIDLSALGTDGRLRLGGGRYETLVRTDDLDGVPTVTFTAPEPMRPVNAPSDAYLRMLASGLVQAHRWSRDETAAYLASLTGVGRTAAEIAGLLAS